MAFMLGLADCSGERVVDALGRPPRSSSAYRQLLRRGQAAVPAIRAGLHHLDPAVREQCGRLIDHLLIQDAVGDLIAMLDDPVPAARQKAGWYAPGGTIYRRTADHRTGAVAGRTSP